MTSTPSISKAAFWMAMSIASFLGMTVAGRETTKLLNVFQVMELRSLIGIIILLPLVFASGGLPAMRTARPLQHIGRNVVHYTGQAAWLFGLTLIPLAQLVSIEFTSPIWTVFLAVAFLGERLNVRKLIAISFGMLGVIIIVRPGISTFDPGHVVVLGAAISFAISMVMVKSLTRTESVVRIIFWMLVIQSVLGLAPALYEWRNPPLALWPWILMIAFTGMSSHFCLARALVFADATIVSPMDFLRLPLTALLGFMLYSEQIDLFTIAGGALILLGNLLNLRRRPLKPAEIAAS